MISSPFFMFDHRIFLTFGYRPKARKPNNARPCCIFGICNCLIVAVFKKRSEPNTTVRGGTRSENVQNTKFWRSGQLRGLEGGRYCVSYDHGQPQNRSRRLCGILVTANQGDRARVTRIVWIQVHVSKRVGHRSAEAASAVASRNIGGRPGRHCSGVRRPGDVGGAARRVGEVQLRVQHRNDGVCR